MESVAGVMFIETEKKQEESRRQTQESKAPYPHAFQSASIPLAKSGREPAGKGEMWLAKSLPQHVNIMKKNMGLGAVCV